MARFAQDIEQLKAEIACKEAELGVLSQEAAELDEMVKEKLALQEEIESQMEMAKNEKKWAEQFTKEAVKSTEMQEAKLAALKADCSKVGKGVCDGGRYHDEGVVSTLYICMMPSINHVLLQHCATSLWSEVSELKLRRARDMWCKQAEGTCQHPFLQPYLEVACPRHELAH